LVDEAFCLLFEVKILKFDVLSLVLRQYKMLSSLYFSNPFSNYLISKFPNYLI
jgi:hypothetical protein